jgi:hypothetical protein
MHHETAVLQDAIPMALNLVRSMVEPLLATSHFRRKGIHINIMFENAKGEPCVPVFATMGSDPQEEDKELGEQTYDYREIAHRKARMCLREKCSSAFINLEAPQLLKPLDTSYGGGVYRPGFAVGVSALHDREDELVANWIADAVIFYCHELREKMGLVDYYPERDLK